MCSASALPATFVMPFYGDAPEQLDYLKAAIDGLYRQTSPEWNLVVIDDASPLPGHRQHLREIEAASSGRITVLSQRSNRGQGACRNMGTQWAVAHGAEMILFHDADDVSHPRRLDLTRLAFAENPDVDFVYSTFIVIDEHGETVPMSQLTPSVAEILEPHRRRPVHGPDAWIRMGVETGFTTPTTTVGVRSRLAVAQPFAEVRGSEDTNTYFRMAAASTGIEYIPSMPQLYRIPQRVRGSADRSRLGSRYYHMMARNDRAGFFSAVEIALLGGKVTSDRVPVLQAGFLLRLSQTMAREGQHQLACELRREAAVIGAPYAHCPA